ncbi:binding-protein-dependent transport systems inner membrane component [Xylanimonas cellulosilytica DSM 15894]|uniref:Binding-protein-dependent transport systems inner membrane component n=1 Tax=Xylanimonas cellulosilytica (strain DSM 15894 / JCM 12276 / CECT 5975 / KCTC 9989 / LMG 20990 / NBRC 107835 / XIL07) TaxID=446471 RepID=D1BX95_XYLCX|nr:carbohydrate ABC transporter permease [Xylanimonas cellulosilytica]ACZ31663.1 binding-protein-dependent transport systems inner membrane component [Xylanimonas cellulosilytica DSM 15894]
MTATTTLPPRPATVANERNIRRYRRRRMITAALRHLGLIALAALMIYPLVWLIVSSFKPNADIFRDLSIFTTNLTTENYPHAWNAQKYPFGHYLMNSMIISGAAIVGNLVSCSLAAYAFARLRFRGRNLMFAAMLMSIMLPFHVVLVPQFLIFKQLDWLNTFLPLIVPKFLAADAFFVFLMVQFIRALPKEIFEAARIDGAGHPRMYAFITLPLMVPALATTAIFTFIWTWSDFFGPLIYLRTPEVFTAAIALKGFLDSQESSNYGAMFAMSIVSLIPLFIIFLVGQRYLVKGFATTGIK